MNSRPAEPRSILIVRLSAMGDLVFTTPLLSSLRARFPQARICWLVRKELAPLLAEDPDLDEVIAWTPPKGHGWLPHWRSLRKQLQPYQFDWVIDAQGLLKSRIVASAAGGWRLGFDSKEPARWLMHELLPKQGDNSLIGSEYRWLAEQLTDQPSQPPRLRISARAREQVSEQCQNLGLQSQPIIVCPFTTRPQKHWPEEYWPQLIAGLTERFNVPVLMMGGPADRAAATRIQNQLGEAGGRLINLVGQTSISDTPAWIARARLLVGVDTGLTHMGAALARPTIALFGSTCPYTDGARGPLKVMYEGLSCAPCRRRPSCDGAFTCLRLLTPERVLATAQSLLRGAEMS